MKYLFCIIFVGLFSCETNTEQTPQSKIVVEGQVLSKIGMKDQSGAKISWFQGGVKESVIADSNGFFNIELNEGNHSLTITQNGFSPTTYDVSLNSVGARIDGDRVHYENIIILMEKADQTFASQLFYIKNGFLKNVSNMTYSLSYGHTEKNVDSKYGHIAYTSIEGITDASGKVSIDNLPDVKIQFTGNINIESIGTIHFYFKGFPKHVWQKFIGLMHSSLEDNGHYIRFIESTNIANSSGNSVLNFNRSETIQLTFSGYVWELYNTEILLQTYPGNMSVNSIISWEHQDGKTTLYIDPHSDLTLGQSYILRITLPKSNYFYNLNYGIQQIELVFAVE